MALIDDPWFYAVAIPAVLMLGVSKSGFGAGFGSLAVPLLALTVPVPQAAALLMPVLLVMDVLGLAAYLKLFDRRLIALLLPAGLAGTLLGWALFSALSVQAVEALVGAFTLAFLVQRRLVAPRLAAAAAARGETAYGAAAAVPAAGARWGTVAPHAPPRPLAGRLLALVSGFTSFVAHAGGPPVSAYLVPLRLDPLRFNATAAVFFAAINASKWIPYAWLGLLDARNLYTSLILCAVAPAGVLVGVRIARRVRADAFYLAIELGMLLTGVKLLADALA